MAGAEVEARTANVVDTAAPTLSGSKEEEQVASAPESKVVEQQPEPQAVEYIRLRSKDGQEFVVPLDILSDCSTIVRMVESDDFIEKDAVFTVQR